MENTQNCSILWGYLSRMQTMPKNFEARLISDAHTRALKFKKGGKKVIQYNATCCAVITLGRLAENLLKKAVANKKSTAECTGAGRRLR